MSTSSKPKNGPPAHQNRRAFRHNKNSKFTKQIAESMTTYGLCPRCTDKQQWRVKYRKYKPLSGPRKCNECGNRNVKAAYRVLCGSCAGARGACSGCAEARGARAVDREARQGAAGEGMLGRRGKQTEDSAMDDVLRSMTERQRRSVHRRVEAGEDFVEVVSKLNGMDGDHDDDDDIGNGEDGGDSLNAAHGEEQKGGDGVDGQGKKEGSGVGAERNRDGESGDSSDDS